MAAVIRVKRRLEDEPLDAIIVNCKKRKTDTKSPNDQPELSALLKFAGTTKSQEEDIFEHLKKPTKTELEEKFKKHNVDLSAKIRKQKKQDSKNNRYKVVNCYRSSSSQNNESTSNSEYTIYDIETESHEDISHDAATVSKYVFDLYYTTSDDLGDVISDYVSVYPLNDELMFGSMRDNGVNDEDSDDSEDSNAECNWRNDYPDESDMESINEDDMIDAIKKIDIRDDTLSSDDGDEGFIYSVDSEAAGFEEDIDDSDVQRYGERYARFKARHKSDKLQSSGLEKDLYYGDIDEEEYYY